MHPDSLGFKVTCDRCGRSSWAIDQRRHSGPENKTCGCDGVHTAQGRPVKPHRWGCKGCVHREDLVINAAMAGRATAEDNSWLEVESESDHTSSRAETPALGRGLGQQAPW